MSRLVNAGAAVAAAGALHAVVNARLLRRPRPDPAAPAARVSVLLPVRDEAERVGPCLAALLAQTTPVEILVLDDGSTDDTTDVVRRLAGPRLTEWQPGQPPSRPAHAAPAGQFPASPATGWPATAAPTTAPPVTAPPATAAPVTTPPATAPPPVTAPPATGWPRVVLHRGSAPPPGWLGKPHACAQLAASADPASTVLVFVDADVVLAPHAVAAAVELLDRTALDLVSPYPRQVAVSPAERLVQPLLQWSIMTFLPLRLAERSDRPSLAAANGQFLVVRRAAYDRAGGHAAVRAEVLDDLALLRAVLRAGGHGAVVDGTDLARCRMYRGLSELADGYGKSLWQAFGSPAGAAGVLGLFALAYLLPPLAALIGSRAGLAGYAAAVAGRVVTARRTGGRIWPDAAAHPVSVAAFTALTVRSLLLRRRGRLAWKGRPL